MVPVILKSFHTLKDDVFEQTCRPIFVLPFTWEVFMKTGVRKLLMTFSRMISVALPTTRQNIYTIQQGVCT